MAEKTQKATFRKARWEQAINDPLFLNDISDTEEMFRSADEETLGRTE